MNATLCRPLRNVDDTRGLAELVGVHCDLCDKPITHFEDVSYWEDFWTFPTELDALLCRRCGFETLEELP